MIKLKIIKCLVVAGTWFFVNAVNAQTTTFQTDKPGKFVLINSLGKCPGQDITTYAKNTRKIVEWVRQNNAVLNQPTGFNASVDMYGNLCGNNHTKAWNYGIQSAINFTFNYFYSKDGVPKIATGWLAHNTEFKINQPISHISTQYGEAGFKTENPAYLKEPLEKALNHLKQYYRSEPVVKEIASGVRIYSVRQGSWLTGTILIFNPNRPDIWMPVTVKEILEAQLGYYKVKEQIDSIEQEIILKNWAKMGFKPDTSQKMTTSVYKEIKKEYESFTADELNHWAYSAPSETVTSINAKGEGIPVVRFNPQCWDKTLPTSAVQFISIEYRLASEALLEEFMQNNLGLTDFVGLFFNKLPVEKMGILIQKK